jgi:hypothetical protein
MSGGVVAQPAAAAGEFHDRAGCWCCGELQAPQRLLHLGNHPEVGICLGWAHFLHQQTLGLEDELRSSPLIFLLSAAVCMWRRSSTAR